MPGSRAHISHIRGFMQSSQGRERLTARGRPSSYSPTAAHGPPELAAFVFGLVVACPTPEKESCVSQSCLGRRALPEEKGQAGPRAGATLSWSCSFGARMSRGRADEEGEEGTAKWRKPQSFSR